MKTNVTSGRPPEGAAGVNTRALRCTHKGQMVQVCMPRGGAHTGGAHGALRCTRGGGAARRQHSPPEEVHRPRSGQMCACISVRGPSAHAPPVTGQPRWRQEYKGAGGETGPHPGARDEAFRPSAGQRPRVRLLFRAATVASPPLQRPQPSRARNPSPHRPPRHLSQGSAHPPAGRWGRVGTGRLSSGRAAASTDRGGQAGTASCRTPRSASTQLLSLRLCSPGAPRAACTSSRGSWACSSHHHSESARRCPSQRPRSPSRPQGAAARQPYLPRPTPFSKAPSCHFAHAAPSA